jgi:Late competence development protein ComFB
MEADFSSIHNRHERPVYDEVRKAAVRYPSVAKDPELLVDAACLALNSLKAHYIRNAVDLLFYLSEAERTQDDTAIRVAVNSALTYIQSRALTVGAR